MASWRNHGPEVLWRLARIMWHYRIRPSVRVPYSPYRLWIEPTALCNLSCRYCPNKTLRAQTKLGMMSWDLFTNIVDQAVEFAHDVNLMHRGESLLHPEFVRMVHYAGERGLFCKLHTNATLLDADMTEQLLDAPLGLLSFSFDGYDPETYEYYRVGADYDAVLENIQRLLRHKQERGQALPYTVIEVMDLPDREGAFAEEKRRQFTQQLLDLGLNKIIVKRPHNWAGSVSLGTDNSVGAERLSPCTFLWHSLVVLWDGAVSACPHDFFAKINLGDATRQPLAEIFNGEPLMALRRAMLDKRFGELDPCADCSTLRRDTVLGIPKQSLKFLRW